MGRAETLRRVMVALLKDFLLAMGLLGGLVDPPVISVCISSLSVSRSVSATVSGICVAVVEDWTSVRGDLCGGAESGFEDEHLLSV